MKCRKFCVGLQTRECVYIIPCVYIYIYIYNIGECVNVQPLGTMHVLYMCVVCSLVGCVVLSIVCCWLCVLCFICAVAVCCM